MTTFACTLIFHPDKGTVDRVFPKGKVREDVAYLEKSTGYKRFGWKNKIHYVHRMIWEHVNGPIPEGLEIDHIDGDRSNNVIWNLRLVTSSQNKENQWGPQKNNTSGFKGVWKGKNKWHARIQSGRHQMHIGSYKTGEEAAEAYRKAAAIYHTHNPDASI